VHPGPVSFGGSATRMPRSYRQRSTLGESQIRRNMAQTRQSPVYQVEAAIPCRSSRWRRRIRMMRSSGSHINGCELLLLDEESIVAAALLHSCPLALLPSCPLFRLFGEKEAMRRHPARGRRRKTLVCVRGCIRGRGKKGERTGRRGSLASKTNWQQSSCSHPKPLTCGPGKLGPTSD